MDDSGSFLPVGKCHFKVNKKDKENFADFVVLSVLLTLSRYLATSMNHPKFIFEQYIDVFKITRQLFRCSLERLLIISLNSQKKTAKETFLSKSEQLFSASWWLLLKLLFKIQKKVSTYVGLKQILFTNSAKNLSYGQYEIVMFYFLSLTCILSQYFVIIIFQEMCFV